MTDIIVLFTPLHTGTHYVRMLLETHPEISGAIAEDYRIDSKFRPEFVLPGRGMGWDDPTVRPGKDRGTERMLLEYFRDYLQGKNR